MIKMVGKENFKVPKEGMAQGTMFIEINPAYLEGDKTEIKLEVYNRNKRIDTEVTNFLGPRTFN